MEIKWSKETQAYFLRRHDMPVFILGLKRDLRTLPTLSPPVPQNQNHNNSRNQIHNSRDEITSNSDNSSRLEKGGNIPSSDTPPPSYDEATLHTTLSSLTIDPQPSSHLEEQHAGSTLPNSSVISGQNDVKDGLEHKMQSLSLSESTNTKARADTSTQLHPSQNGSSIPPSVLETQNKRSVIPQQGYKTAQDLRCDRYMECSAVTGELVKEVFQDIAATAMDIVRKRKEGAGAGWGANWRSDGAQGGLSEGGCILQ